MRILYRALVNCVLVNCVLWGCCLTAGAQTPFYGYYDSNNFETDVGHGGPDNYTNQYAVNWSDERAVADQALADGQRLAIFHQSSTNNLADPSNPGSLPNSLRISAHKWEPYRQAGVIDFLYTIDAPYSKYNFSEIETMIDLFKDNMPGIDIGLNFDAGDLAEPVFQASGGVPTNLDFVGMTYYPYDSGGGPTNQTEFDNGFNPIRDAMRAEVTASQKLYLIGQSFTQEPTPIQPHDQSPHFYANALTTNSDLVGMQWFKWRSAVGPPVLTGADSLPASFVNEIKDAGQTDLSIPTSPAAIPPPPDYKAGLIDKWTFNNASGAVGATVQSDGGAIGLTGSIHTGGELEVLNTQGGGNKGLEFFNGGASPDRIDLESSHRYGNHSVDQVTIEAWVRQHGSPGKQAIVSKTDELFFGSVSTPDPGNPLTDLVFLTGGFDTNLRTPLTAGAWHHVAYVIEGTDGGGGDMERLYVNGVEAASRVSQWAGITNEDDDLNIGFAEGVNGFGFRGVMDEVRIYDTARTPTEIADSFTTGPEVPNPITLQTIYFEDFESGYSNGDPVTNKAEWTVGNATVIDSPGVLGGGTAPGLPDGHGLVLGGFVDTTENKLSFGDVTADKVYFSFDLYQVVDHNRGLTFDVVDGPSDAVDTVYAIWNKSSTDVIDHNAGGVSQPNVDYDMPENDWMHVEIVLDQIADTFDLMIGGELLLDDAGLKLPVTAADLISWSSHTVNGVFIDNIFVGIEATTNNADFDGSGLVDGNDFLLWQRGFGSAGQTDNSMGDADGNGIVDDADLAVWEAQYGSPPPPLVSAASAVPEPASSLLMLLGLVTVASRRSRTLDQRRP